MAFPPSSSSKYCLLPFPNEIRIPISKRSTCGCFLPEPWAVTSPRNGAVATGLPGGPPVATGQGPARPALLASSWMHLELLQAPESHANGRK